MAQNEWTCCCWSWKMHVEKGAWIIAIVGCVLNILSAILYFLPSTSQNMIFGISSVVAFFVYLSVIFAIRKRNHRYYWPYLIVEGISLVLQFIFIPVCIYFLIAAPIWMIDDFNNSKPELKMDESGFRVFIGFILFLVVFSAAINVWFYWIIYKAYKFVRDEPVGGMVQFQNYPTV